MHGCTILTLWATEGVHSRVYAERSRLPPLLHRTPTTTQAPAACIAAQAGARTRVRRTLSAASCRCSQSEPHGAGWKTPLRSARTSRHCTHGTGSNAHPCGCEADACTHAVLTCEPVQACAHVPYTHAACACKQAPSISSFARICVCTLCSA